jgi:hypothetical protein
MALASRQHLLPNCATGWSARRGAGRAADGFAKLAAPYRLWMMALSGHFYCRLRLRFTSSVGDLTAYMNNHARPEDAIRIGTPLDKAFVTGTVARLLQEDWNAWE